MRLIDADILIDYFYYGIDDKPIIDGISDRKIIDIIKNQPTTYDIDKVVEELEKVKTINVDVGFGTIYKTIRKDTVIEIVKRGGVKNEVAEYV